MAALSQMISIAVHRYAVESEQGSATCGNPGGRAFGLVSFMFLFEMLLSCDAKTSNKTTIKHGSFKHCVMLHLTIIPKNISLKYDT